MKLTAIRSAVIASSVLMAGALVSAPVYAQAGSNNAQQKAAEMRAKGQDEMGGERGRDEAERAREQARDREREDGVKDQAERMREMQQEQEARARENANRANENRKADPANKGSDQGQARKQEKAKAWWNFWG